MNQDEIAYRLRDSVNSDESYEPFFEILAEAQDEVEVFGQTLLNALVDIALSGEVEFSVRDAVFELVRQFCCIEPITVFRTLAYKEHADYIFDSVIIGDIIRSGTDVMEINNKYQDSPNYLEYNKIIRGFARKQDRL